MAVFSAWSSKDCSGDRCQSCPNRVVQYDVQNSHKHANQGAVLPAATSGLEEISQPFASLSDEPVTKCRKRKRNDRHLVTWPFLTWYRKEIGLSSFSRSVAPCVASS